MIAGVFALSAMVGAASSINAAPTAKTNASNKNLKRQAPRYQSHQSRQNQSKALPQASQFRNGARRSTQRGYKQDGYNNRYRYDNRSGSIGPYYRNYPSQDSAPYYGDQYPAPYSDSGHYPDNDNAGAYYPGPYDNGTYDNGYYPDPYDNGYNNGGYYDGGDDIGAILDTVLNGGLGSGNGDILGGVLGRDGSKEQILGAILGSVIK